MYVLRRVFRFDQGSGSRAQGEGLMKCTGLLQGPKKLPISFWGPLEVTYTRNIQGIWNHDIGNYL